MRKAAVYCVTYDYYKKIIPSMKSLLACTPIDTVYVLAEDDALNWDTPDRVKVINVSGQTFFRPDGPNYKCVWSYMVLMRAALPMILGGEDRVLSLDADTIVRKDVSPLWDLPMDDAYFAAAREVPMTRQKQDTYYNFGVSFLNLRKLRQDGMAERIVRALNERHFTYCEQDAYRELCQGHIKEIPGTYNHSRVSVQFPDEEIRIRHWPGERFWWEDKEVQRWLKAEWAT